MAQDTDEEKAFRERYAHALRLMKGTDFVNPHFGTDELIDERNRVKKQALMTPGRRGEQIKHEEIDREICRRYTLTRDGKISGGDKHAKKTEIRLIITGLNSVGALFPPSQLQKR